jgi:hypothetical protein
MKLSAKFVGSLSLLFALGSLPAAASTYVVDRLTDNNPTGGGEGSGLTGDLRYAVTNAQSGDSVTFSVTGTIDLAAGLPGLTEDISVAGPGATSLTVDGAGGSVFSVALGTTVVLSGLTIRGGSGNGGGVFNRGTLTLNSVAVSGNTAGCLNCGLGTGGGIWNYANAALTVNDSTISGNSALGSSFYGPSRGGGIANDGTLTLTNSTVSGNVSNFGSGGGIHNTGTATLESSTVSGNSGNSGAGGIVNSGTLNTRNSIIAGNTSSDLSGVPTSQGYNVIGTGGSGFVATDLTNADPMLRPLANYGGPTSTMAPWPDGPGVGRIPGTAGTDFPAADQRGTFRPQGAQADSGAVEVVPPASPFDTTTTTIAATGTFGQTVALKGTLTQATVPLSSRSLSFTVDAISAGSATTNSTGAATLNFVIPESLGVGAKTITATYAGNTYFNGSNGTNTLTVSKGNTTLTVPAKSVNINGSGGTVTLEATLKRSTGSAPLSGKTVEFKVDSVSIGTATTDSSGLASKVHTVAPGTSTGSHPTNASFAGDVLYNSSTKNSTLTVKIATTLVVPNQTGTAGNNVTLSATLTRNTDGAAISGATVTFQLDDGEGWTTLGTGTTDASGGATLVYAIPAGTDPGPYAIRGIYNGSSVYASSTGNGTLTVN